MAVSEALVAACQFPSQKRFSLGRARALLHKLVWFLLEEGHLACVYFRELLVGLEVLVGKFDPEATLMSFQPHRRLDLRCHPI